MNEKMVQLSFPPPPPSQAMFVSLKTGLDHRKQTAIEFSLSSSINCSVLDTLVTEISSPT